MIVTQTIEELQSRAAASTERELMAWRAEWERHQTRAIEDARRVPFAGHGVHTQSLCDMVLDIIKAEFIGRHKGA